MDLQEVSIVLKHIKWNLLNFKSLAGKTLLARAVAHHTECTFIRVSGSELVQKFIGEGSRMVRELFVMAREHAPSIVS
jgi:ATP-dependent 26S proteasome regulatory subunit